MSGCQVNSHKCPGLTAFNDLVRGNKGAGHDVLIVGCTNQPADYSNKQLCDCAFKSLAHAEEAEKRGLICFDFQDWNTQLEITDTKKSDDSTKSYLVDLKTEAGELRLKIETQKAICCRI